MDIWEYIGQERIPLPFIYFSHRREVFRRDGMLMACSPVDDGKSTLIGRLLYDTKSIFSLVDARKGLLE